MNADLIFTTVVHWLLVKIQREGINVNVLLVATQEINAQVSNFNLLTSMRFLIIEKWH